MFLRQELLQGFHSVLVFTECTGFTVIWDCSVGFHSPGCHFHCCCWFHNIRCRVNHSLHLK